jgi:cell shape-determining protein MreC
MAKNLGEAEDKAKEALVGRTELEEKNETLNRQLELKTIEVTVLKNKLKQVKDENVSIRMQLLDPSNIKRGPPVDNDG